MYLRRCSCALVNGTSAHVVWSILPRKTQHAPISPNSSAFRQQRSFITLKLLVQTKFVSEFVGAFDTFDLDGTRTKLAHALMAMSGRSKRT